MSEISSYKQILIHDGLKNTKHRNSILNIIQKSVQPLTIEQIYLELINQEISINLSSVYRNLKILAEKGLIIKTSMTGNKALFEFNNFEHKHHLICIKCNRIISIGECPFAEYEKKLKEKCGFNITGHKLEIYGVCNDCNIDKNHNADKTKKP